MCYLLFLTDKQHTTFGTSCNNFKIKISIFITYKNINFIYCTENRYIHFYNGLMLVTCSKYLIMYVDISSSCR